MKTNRKPKRLFLLLAFSAAAVVLLPQRSFSQPPPPPPPVDNPTDAPIDGGLTLLLAAGAAYGVKKVRERRKQGKVNEEEIS